jgi:hypothetical protein
MSRAAPGGALLEGRFRSRVLLPGGSRHGREEHDPPIPLVPRIRRRRWRTRLLILGAVAALGVAAWAVYASPLLHRRHQPAAERPSGVAATRVPAVGVPVATGVRVFDAAGEDLGTVARVPSGVPLIAVEPAALSSRTVLAALQVRRELPAALAAEVTQVGATSPAGVWLRLRDGARVTWGSPGAAAAKAAAVATLRRTVPAGHRATIDVSAPTAPAVSW